MTIKHKRCILGLVVVAVLSTATSAFALLPIRRPSDNGIGQDASAWLLLGRTAPITITGNGKSVSMSREVVCPNQDVEASLSAPTEENSGSCDSGVYLFIFQFQSTATNVDLQIDRLLNFVADKTLPNYGVMLCDPSGGEFSNTLELCTDNPSGAQIPNITFTSSKTTVHFIIPSFPNVPAGTTQQGKGLTIFIETQQTSPLPIHFPVPGVH
jgi:hypothetical protein